ncbi:IclR family transcriptional regulator [Jiangella mangrovi]|uniref:DNA-binding IclR family transcriptional regulator n=1 Tax=Jiangella mangrovi TaxID=1524084 RepID=A0A7W9LPG4_9ACTN|nr:IclR family transcriptional regulator [Jiangella mangrovi]MBB5791276.1 DNA-binding IclR family transcriptional regulator [Jiangella mangrovi]
MSRSQPPGWRRSSDSETDAVHYHAQALSRGLNLLEILARGRSPQTIADFHEHTGMPKSTLVRLLSVLDREEYVVRVDERPAYRLGHKVQILSDAYVAQLDISQVAGRYLEELAGETGQTGNLGLLDGDQVLHVCVREPDRALRYASAAGHRAPAYVSGLGKVLLATLDAADVAPHTPAEPFPAYTDRTITTLAALQRELRTTMRRGYGFDDNESSTGLRCLAVPVAVRGEVLAAISVSGPSAEFGLEEQKRYLTVLGRIASGLAGDADVVAVLEYLRSSLLRSTIEPVG